MMWVEVGGELGVELGWGWGGGGVIRPYVGSLRPPPFASFQQLSATPMHQGLDIHPTQKQSEGNSF